MVSPPWNAELAPELFRKAFAEAAVQSNLAPVDAGSAMADGDCMECEVFHRQLAHQVVLYLAEREPGLRAVYRFDPSFASGEDGRIRALPSESSMIYLLVWAAAKSDALAAEVKALQEAFAEERLNWVCPKALEWCHALDIVVLDDADVDARRGYAAVLDSVWVRPTQVWGASDALARRRASHALA